MDTEDREYETYEDIPEAIRNGLEAAVASALDVLIYCQVDGDDPRTRAYEAIAEVFPAGGQLYELYLDAGKDLEWIDQFLECWSEVDNDRGEGPAVDVPRDYNIN